MLIQDAPCVVAVYLTSYVVAHHKWLSYSGNLRNSKHLH